MTTATGQKSSANNYELQQDAIESRRINNTLLQAICKYQNIETPDEAEARLLQIIKSQSLGQNSGFADESEALVFYRKQKHNLDAFLTNVLYFEDGFDADLAKSLQKFCARRHSPPTTLEQLELAVVAFAIERLAVLMFNNMLCFSADTDMPPSIASAIPTRAARLAALGWAEK